LNKNAASGVDRVTAEAYEENLEASVKALISRADRRREADMAVTIAPRVSCDKSPFSPARAGRPGKWTTKTLPSKRFAW